MIHYNQRINKEQNEFLKKCHKKFKQNDPLSCEGDYFEHENGMRAYNDGFSTLLLHNGKVLAYIDHEY